MKLILKDQGNKTEEMDDFIKNLEEKNNLKFEAMSKIIDHLEGDYEQLKKQINLDQKSYYENQKNSLDKWIQNSSEKFGKLVNDFNQKQLMLQKNFSDFKNNQKLLYKDLQQQIENQNLKQTEISEGLENRIRVSDEVQEMKINGNKEELQNQIQQKYDHLKQKFENQMENMEKSIFNQLKDSQLNQENKLKGDIQTFSKRIEEQVQETQMVLHKRMKNNVEELKKETEKALIIYKVQIENEMTKMKNEMKELEDFRSFVHQFEEKIENQKKFLLQKIDNIQNLNKDQVEKIKEETNFEIEEFKKSINHNINKNSKMINDFTSKQQQLQSDWQKDNSQKNQIFVSEFQQQIISMINNYKQIQENSISNVKQDLATFNDINNQKMEELHENAKALIQANVINEQRIREQENKELKDMIENKEDFLNEKISEGITLLNMMIENLEESIKNKMKEEKAKNTLNLEEMEKKIHNTIDYQQKHFDSQIFKDSIFFRAEISSIKNHYDTLLNDLQVNLQHQDKRNKEFHTNMINLKESFETTIQQQSDQYQSAMYLENLYNRAELQQTLEYCQLIATQIKELEQNLGDKGLNMNKKIEEMEKKLSLNIIKVQQEQEQQSKYLQENFNNEMTQMKRQTNNEIEVTKNEVKQQLLEKLKQLRDCTKQELENMYNSNQQNSLEINSSLFYQQAVSLAIEQNITNSINNKIEEIENLANQNTVKNIEASNSQISAIKKSLAEDIRSLGVQIQSEMLEQKMINQSIEKQIESKINDLITKTDQIVSRNSKKQNDTSQDLDNLKLLIEQIQGNLNQQQKLNSQNFSQIDQVLLSFKTHFTEIQAQSAQDKLINESSFQKVDQGLNQLEKEMKQLNELYKEQKGSQMSQNSIVELQQQIQSLDDQIQKLQNSSKNNFHSFNDILKNYQNEFNKIQAKFIEGGIKGVIDQDELKYNINQIGLASNENLEQVKRMIKKEKFYRQKQCKEIEETIVEQYQKELTVLKNQMRTLKKQKQENQELLQSN